MWWLERRGGQIWKKPDAKVEMTVREAPAVIDSSKLTFEERQQMRELLEGIEARMPESSVVAEQGPCADE